MAYEPTVWTKGDTISAERMNKIETGIVEASSTGGGAFVVVDDGSGTLDKTAQEIIDAVQAGQMVMLYKYEDSGEVESNEPNV